MGLPLRIVKSKPLNGVGDWIATATETVPGVSDIWNIVLQSGIAFQINRTLATQTADPVAGMLCVFGLDGGWRNIDDCITRAEAPVVGEQPAVQFMGVTSIALMDFHPDDILDFPWAPPVVP